MKNKVTIISRMIIFYIHLLFFFSIYIYCSDKIEMNTFLRLIILFLYIVVSFLSTEGVRFYFYLYKNYKNKKKSERLNSNVIAFHTTKKSLINRIRKRPKH